MVAMISHRSKYALPGITEDDFDASDFSYLAIEIVDTFRFSITEVDIDRLIEVEALRQRLEDMEALPEEWVTSGHPMQPFLDEIIEERNALRSLFDEFGDVISEEDYAFQRRTIFGTTR